MSYTIETLFQGDLNTPATERVFKLGELTMHQNGDVTIGNRWYGRHSQIDIDTPFQQIRRDEWSDIISVERDGKQILVLEYAGIGECRGTWQRLVPDGDYRLEFTTPGPLKRHLISTIDFAFVILGMFLHLTQAACDGWTNTNRR